MANTKINMFKKLDWEWLGNTHEINPIEVESSWVCSMWRHKPTGVSIGLTRLVDLNSDRTLSIRDEIDAVSTGFSFLADFDGFYHSFFDMIEDDDEEGGCAERIYPDNEIDFFDKTNESLDGLNKEYARMFNKYFRGYWEEHGYSVE